jgi:hypothetical protein
VARLFHRTALSRPSSTVRERSNWRRRALAHANLCILLAPTQVDSALKECYTAQNLLLHDPLRDEPVRRYYLDSVASTLTALRRDQDRLRTRARDCANRRRLAPVTVKRRFILYTGLVEPMPSKSSLGLGHSGNHRHPSRLRGGCGSFGEDVADAADFGAYGFQFFLDVLVAAVQVVDAVDDGLAIRN